MNVRLLLIGSIVFYYGCISKTNVNSTLIKAEGASTVMECTFMNRIEYASFKYTFNDLFKTGKLSKPQLLFSADTLVLFKEKKYQVKLNYFKVRNSILGVGSLTTGNTTVLLFTKEKQFQYFEVKRVGAFEFRGTKDDKDYFRLASKDCNIYFSFNLNKSNVLLTEYTVESE